MQYKGTLHVGHYGQSCLSSIFWLVRSGCSLLMCTVMIRFQTVSNCPIHGATLKPSGGVSGLVGFAEWWWWWWWGGGRISFFYSLSDAELLISQLNTSKVKYHPELNDQHYLHNGRRCGGSTLGKAVFSLCYGSEDLNIHLLPPFFYDSSKSNIIPIHLYSI